MSVARTLIHELIHAEMWRKLLSLAGQGDLNYDNWTIAEQQNYVNSIKDNFPGIYDYYRRYVKNWQHEQMAAHYRDIIEEGLMQYDGSYSNEIYEALAWVGLRGEGGIDYSTGLTNNSTTAWENLSQEERLKHLNNLISFKNNVSACTE